MNDRSNVYATEAERRALLANMPEAGMISRNLFDRALVSLNDAHRRIDAANRRARIHSILTILFLATALTHAAHDFGWLCP